MQHVPVQKEWLLTTASPGANLVIEIIGISVLLVLLIACTAFCVRFVRLARHTRRPRFVAGAIGALAGVIIVGWIIAVASAQPHKITMFPTGIDIASRIGSRSLSFAEITDVHVGFESDGLLGHRKPDWKRKTAVFIKTTDGETIVLKIQGERKATQALGAEIATALQQRSRER